MGWRNENKNAPITIQRKNEKELQVAIADLEERGFELVRVGVYLDEKKGFECKQSSLQRFNKNVFAGTVSFPKHFAVLKRKKPVEMAVPTGG